jgi:hypothetical protein
MIVADEPTSGLLALIASLSDPSRDRDVLDENACAALDLSDMAHIANNSCRFPSPVTAADMGKALWRETANIFRTYVLGAIRERRRRLEQTLYALLAILMTKDAYEQLLRLIHLARPSITPFARTYVGALLAVRQHYGHRFEQDDNSFWSDPKPVFRGAVCALS